MLNPNRLNSPALVDATAEYQSLINRLKDAARKYKLGEVDEESTDGSEHRYLFAEELNQLELLVEEYKDRLLAESPSWYYKFLTIQAEAKEYFDTATPAFSLDRYHVAQELFRTLPKKLPPDTSDEEVIVVKNKIRVIVTGFEYLHMVGNFGTAITYAEDLLSYITTSGLATKKDPAHGTRAVVYFLLGKSLRQRGQDDDNLRAIECFYHCSESYSDMARRRDNQDVDVVYARTRAMVSLAFGAGFLFHNSQSDLVRAKALIAQARLAFLTDTGSIRCKLHFYYLEQLYASILRAEVGDTAVPVEDTEEEQSRQMANQEKLDRARDILAKCEEELKYAPKYLIYVLLNRALLHIYAGPDEYAAARECINKLLDMCRDSSRLLANALVLKSHLERRERNFDAALADAMKAYNQAANHPPVQIEALLARGQAQLERGQFPAARADFEQALQLNNKANPKLAAMALLLLAELAVGENNPRQAHERFKQVKDMMPMSHGYILRKYRRIEREVQELESDFIILGSTTNLNYKEWEASLQRWLIEKAAREETNLTNIARRLNVSKKTVYFWLDKIKKQS